MRQQMIDDDLQEYPDNDQLVIEEDDRYNEDDMYRKVAKLKSNDDNEDGFKTKVDKFEKRVNKLVYERNTEREKRAELEKRLSEVEGRIKKEETDKTDSDYSAKLAELKAQYKKHLSIDDDENYDIEKAVEINDQILELKLQEREEKSKRSKQEPEQHKDKSPLQSEALDDWQQRNGWVFFHEKNKEKIEKTNTIYSKLIEEGYDIEDSDTFAELDKRLGNENKQSDKKPDRQKQPVVSGVDRGEGSSKSNENSTFTVADKEKMKSWGLNPNDSDARAEYLKNKTGR
jgi:hypothetical protein